MKKSLCKLFVFGAILSTTSMISCKTSSGYGCDFAEVTTPSEQKTTIKTPDNILKPNYNVFREVSE